MAAIGVGDGLAPAGGDAALEADDLMHEPVVARQRDATAVEQGQEVAEQLALALLRQLVADAVLAEWLTAEAVGLSRNTRAQESAEMRNFDRV